VVVTPSREGGSDDGAVRFAECALTGGKCTADDRVPRQRHVNGCHAATRV